MLEQVLQYNVHKMLGLLMLSLLLGSGAAQGTGSLRVTEVLATYTPAGLGKLVLLRINAWYLLASYPAAPYQVANGPVMVPLRTVGELLGGTVKLDRARRAGVLVAHPYGTGARSRLEFRAGVASIRVDGQQVYISQAPRWLPKYDELVVPLPTILRPLGAEVVSRRNHMLKLGSETVRRTARFSNPPGQWFPKGYHDTEKLVPNDVTVRRAVDLYKKRFFDVSLSLQSEPAVRQGQQGLFTYVQYRNGQAAVGGRDSALELRFGPQNKDPCIKEADTFTCRTFFFSGQLFDYIVTRVQVRD